MRRGPGTHLESDCHVGCPRAVARLKRRADFVRVSGGARWHGQAFTLQAAARSPRAETLPVPRIGFTLTKKVGCAVVRNRARRRLREAIRLSGELHVQADHDYVVVGRIDAIRVSFEALRLELARGVDAVHDAVPGARHGSRTKNKQGRARRTDPTRAGLERTKPQS